MADHRDAVTVQACALLRGDLPDLCPHTYTALDIGFADALKHDDATAAALIRQLADEAHISARLHTYENALAEETVADSHVVRGADEFNGLPGNPAAATATIWTCPNDPPGHFRRLQRGRPEDVGPCTEHDVPLVRENPDT
ncbi:MAG: hypothetical protein CSA58_00800 [Micrococcales bacterium]|nr:MAG: hypothetical protein CSA58_00800 [Micrococcales bacterium]